MFLNLVTLVLVATITFLHSIFGLFTGLINVFCTILSVVVAFGFYEPLNSLVTSQLAVPPSYTEPVCLVVLFLVTLIVTRALADNYIRGNVKLPMALDWGGAAVCGFINAELIVGTLAIGTMMLPLGGKVLSFSRYQRTEDEGNPDHPELAGFQRQHLWTRCDEFTVGLFSLLSSGSLSGSTAFASVYPNFPDAVFFSTNTVQAQSSPSVYRDSKAGDGFTKGLSVVEWWVVDKPVETRYRQERPTARNPNPRYERKTFTPAGGKKLIAVRLKLDKSSADQQKNAYLQLFRPTMLRLVGTRGDKPAQAVARILGNADRELRDALRLVDYDNNFELEGEGTPEIDAYFEVDEDFRPAFVEYRRHARAALVGAEKVKTAPGALETVAAVPEHPGGRGEASGRRSFGSVLAGGSGDTARLPFSMARAALRRAGRDVRFEGDGLAIGRITGARQDLEGASGEERIQDFWVPSGRRLMQVRYKPKQARTIVGDVFNYVGQVNQYFIVDKAANAYPLVGYFATVQRDGAEYIELFYAGDPDDPAATSFRHMLDFKAVQRSELNDQDNAVIGLLFLVPPNEEFVRVENQTHDGGDVKLASRGP